MLARSGEHAFVSRHFRVQSVVNCTTRLRALVGPERCFTAEAENGRSGKGWRDRGLRKLREKQTASMRGKDGNLDMTSFANGVSIQHEKNESLKRC